MSWPTTVRREDLRVEFFRGSGAGGQKRNKTSSAVRLTHVPTGLRAQSQEERSQAQNLKTAWHRLCDQLLPLMKREAQRARYAAGDQRIRTYHEPRQQVTDVRLPDRHWGYDEVIDGRALDDIVAALISESAK